MGASDANQRDLVEVADRVAVRLLPYHFAKARGVITARFHGTNEIEVWLAPNPESSTLAEVRRLTGKTVKHVLLSADEFQTRLARAYAFGSDEESGDHVAEIASNIESEADLAALTESLPEITDLLETENDAPIV
jgi:general secretion pathway protein E